MKILICDAPQVDASGYASCSAWQWADYESLVQQQDVNQLSEMLVDFDPELFAMILLTCMLTFIGGHVGGLIVRTLNRS